MTVVYVVGVEAENMSVEGFLAQVFEMTVVLPVDIEVEIWDVGCFVAQVLVQTTLKRLAWLSEAPAVLAT